MDGNLSDKVTRNYGECIVFQSKYAIHHPRLRHEPAARTAFQKAVRYLRAVSKANEARVGLDAEEPARYQE